MKQSTTHLGRILSEGASSSDGMARFNARLIEGNIQGSSGYYPAEVLERDGPTAFPQGTHMHLDHQGWMDQMDQPVGSVKDMAAIIDSTPEYREAANGQPAGLYATIKVLSHQSQFIKEIKDHIGISIVVPALAEDWINPDTNEETQLITKLFAAGPLTRVDFVTYPGANGRVLEMVEAAKMQLPEGAQLITNRPIAKEVVVVTPKESKPMAELTDETAKSLQVSLDSLAVSLSAQAATESARVEAETKLREAASKVDPEEVALGIAKALTESGLPVKAHARVMAMSKGGMPLAEAIASEKEYLGEVSKESAPTDATADIFLFEGGKGQLPLSESVGDSADWTKKYAGSL